MLGRENVLHYLEDENCEDAEALSAVNNLTRCANLVISELSFTYIPMIKREKLIATDGKFYFENLSEKILDIISVTDGDGNEISYTFASTHLVTKVAEAEIEYSYLPANYGLTDVIGYTGKEVNAHTLALGTTSEFLLIERAFTESVMWRERFTSAVAVAVMPRSKTMKGRAWL